MMVNNWGAHFSPPAQLPPGWHYHLAPTFLHQLTNHFYNMGQIVEFSKLLLPIGPQWVGSGKKFHFKVHTTRLLRIKFKTDSKKLHKFDFKMCKQLHTNFYYYITSSSGVTVLAAFNFIRPPSKHLFGGHGYKCNQIGQDWCQITHNRGH